jgi:hypothetical protein
LRQVLIGEVPHTLQFHNQLFFYHQVGDVLADVLALVANGK